MASHQAEAAGGTSSVGFFRFFAFAFVDFFSISPGSRGSAFISSVAGRSVSLPAGDCTDESGETEVTSIEGEKCRVVDDGELGEGESSGAGGRMK